VESGGGLSLLGDVLGFVQLAEPVRFREQWEQAASLRLRAGDTTVLAEYDQHARIRGGEPETMMDAAAAHYLALALDGTDVLLMAADHALRRELSRRIRDDLIRLGAVLAEPTVRIADGATASPGDLIICTRNDHTIQAGEPGRTLANGDLLRIEAVTPPGVIVRRALDADPATDSGDGPTALSCTNISARPSWATPSPTTPPKAAPSPQGWPSSPAPRTASTLTSPSAAAPTPTWPTCSPSPRRSPTRYRARGQHRSWPAPTGLPPGV
jgi:hypothetical protein